MADQQGENQICHVVNFVLDESDTTTELTVRVRGKWFHISLHPNNISPAKTLSRDYKKLFSAAHRQQRYDEAQMRGETVEETSHNDSRNGRKKSSDSGQSTVDSGYVSEEVPEPNEQEKETGEEVEDGTTNAEQELQNWLLTSFGSTFNDLAPEDKQAKEPSLIQWFHTDIFFFSLHASKETDILEPAQEHGKDSEKFIRQNLIPHMSLPKYLRSLPNIPWISPSDVEVLSEAAEPNPVHPAMVRVTRDNGTEATTHFLKLVASGQEPAIKREINLLQEISKRNLHNKGIRAPRLEGLVSDVRNPNSQAQILGFLITAIPSPTPLTHMIDTSIDQSKRERWVEESQRMVDILHENDIIWGDAKADNFVVDEHENLWIIDFGGSYTEGWVDPELMETKEGDDMGIEKIEKALRDPEENSFDPQEEIEGDDGNELGGPGVEEAVVEDRKVEKQPGKRKRNEANEEKDGSMAETKEKRLRKT